MKTKSSTTVRMRYIEDHNEWQKLHNHLVNGKYPVLMDRIPNCPNFHKMYPGCKLGEDNIFQSININLSQGGERMGLKEIIGKSQGWTTHLHCSTGLILCLIGLLCLLFGMEKISGIFAFLTLASILAAQGCTREKLEAMGK